MNVSTERFARNQDLFREVNQRLREVADPAASLTEYVCECSDGLCHDTIELDLSEYDAIRARPKAFVIAPGHEKLERERVLEDENDRFILVEKVVPIDAAEFRRLRPGDRQADSNGF